MPKEQELTRLEEDRQMLLVELAFYVITVIAYGGMVFLAVADFTALASGPRLPIFVLLLLILIGGTVFALYRIRDTWADWRRLQHPSGHTPPG